MYVWFFICILGTIATIPIHFLSVEHLKLQRRYGKEKGTRIGEILGLISGWGFFFFWIGIWTSPQQRFTILIFQNLSMLIPVVNLSIPLLHLVICIPFLATGGCVAINGVKETTLRVAEIHRTEKIVTRGVYSVIRHPQYLGGLLAHVGISFLLSALYALLSTLLFVLIVYLLSWKEEKELTREFGKEYEDYKKKVPIIMPKLRR